MPVLVNSQSGLAEDLPQDQATLALNQGTHEVPLNDPQGNPVTAPLNQAQSLISQGYSQPAPDQLGNLLNYSKYSSTPEQVKTALEGAGSGATFGLSTLGERAAGVNPEDINARSEVNPGTHMLGEVAGLAGSAFIPGYGAANIMGRVGEGVAGLAAKAFGEAALAKVGSAAAKGAVENALFSSGNEASKMFAQDPHQSAETALTSIGLNSLIGGAAGGAFGTVSPLWKAAQETKVGQFLNAITQKANGMEKGTLPDASIGSAAQAAGIDLAPEIKSALSENPEAQGMFQSLAESTTRAGKEAQQSMNAFRSQANNAILSSLGKSPEDVSALEGLSNNDVGSQIKDSLIKEIKQKIDPLSEQFQQIKDRFATTEIAPQETNDLANSIAKFGQDQGYHLLEGSPQGSVVNKVINSLPNIKTLEDMRKLQSSVQELTQNPEMWNLGKGLKNIFRDSEENIVNSRLGAEAPELLQTHQEARAGYREAMNTIDDLNDRLHVGRYAGPGSFVKALGDMQPEDVLRRMTPKNDADLLSTLGEKFPATSQTVKDSYLNQALKIGSQRVAPGEAINPTNLFKAIGQWSPELRQYALPAGAETQLGAIQDLVSKIPKSMNPSGTAKTLDALWSKVPGGATSLISLMTGHNPALGYVLGQLGRLVGREVPDAIKLATLKFLGSDVPINSSAFKVLAELASHSMEGQRLTTNAVKSLFKAGAQVLPQAIEPKEKDIEQLKKKLDKVQTNPEDLLNVGGHVNHYAPDHAVAFGALTARAVQYLNTLKPNTDRMGVLDSDRVPTQGEKAKYNEAIEIAQQPLIVIDKIKKGTLTPDDVTAVKSMFPSWYNSVVQQITTSSIEHLSDENKIPYKLKLSLSQFVGQPLDSTMSPQAFALTQNIDTPQMQPQQSKGKSSTKSLGKSASLAMTPNQSRENTRQANA